MQMNATVEKALLLALASWLGVGCRHATSATLAANQKRMPTTSEYKETRSDIPPQLQPFWAKISQEGEQNRVLNCMEAGLAAMQEGCWRLAEEWLDNALDRIEAIYADRPDAAKARSLWYAEGKKDFKGEPYERVMAYYYRGLLYLRAGDYQNAEACFKSGMLQDARAEEVQYRCDFALMAFLEGWSAQCLGQKDEANEAYREVNSLRQSFVPPDWNHNTLILVETGVSPRKLADGVYHEKLRLFRGKGVEEQFVQLAIDGTETPMMPLEDIAWQAMTRGGRVVEYILKDKAAFKHANERIASVVADVAAAGFVVAPFLQSASVEIQIASGGLAVVSIIEMSIAAKANPHADIRYWRNLPDLVHVHTCRLSTNTPAQIQAHFFDTNRVELIELRKQVPVYYDRQGFGLGWVRARPAW